MSKRRKEATSKKAASTAGKLRNRKGSSKQVKKCVRISDSARDQEVARACLHRALRRHARRIGAELP